MGDFKTGIYSHKITIKLPYDYHKITTQMGDMPGVKLDLRNLFNDLHLRTYPSYREKWEF